MLGVMWVSLPKPHTTTENIVPCVRVKIGGLGLAFESGLATPIIATKRASEGTEPTALAHCQDIADVVYGEGEEVQFLSEIVPSRGIDGLPVFSGGIA